MRCLTLAVVATLTAPQAVGCARANAGEPSAPSADPAAIHSARAALDESISLHGPASEHVLEAAQALIAARPDAATAARAWLAAAEVYFAQGDDMAAIRAAEAGLGFPADSRPGEDAEGRGSQATVLPQPTSSATGLEPEVTNALQRVWIRAMVRGGEPSAAVASVRALLLPPEGGGATLAGAKAASGDGRAGSTQVIEGAPRLFSWSDWRGLLAVAEVRHGRSAASLRALAAWRASLAPGDPGATWAESMLEEVARGAGSMGLDGPGGLRPVGTPAPGAPLVEDVAWAGLDEGQRHAVQACVSQATREAGLPEAGWTAPRWTERCAAVARQLGILVPRSGKLAGIADAQLEGLEVGLALLAAAGTSPQVTWLDPGVDEAGMKRAGSTAIRAGIDTLVGPIGADAIALAQRNLGGFTLIIPGEAAAQAGRVQARDGAKLIPVAATLEGRVAALVRRFTAEDVTRLVVLAPASSYGKRARAAVEVVSRELGLKDLKFIEYPVGTTSFSTFTEGLQGSDRGAAVLVLDTLPRAEAVLRQLRRDGIVAGSRGARFGSTAEGFDPARLVAARGVFEGALLAPPAFATKDEAFSRAFFARFGRAPSDQAVLAWRALREAAGDLAAPGRVEPASPAGTSAVGPGTTDATSGQEIVGVVKGDQLVAP